MNRLAIVSLIGLPIAAAAATVPAGAATAVHYKIVRLHADATPAKTPNTDIVGNGKKAVYKPTSLKVKEDTSGNNCSTGFVSFTISNTGTKTAYLAIDGSAINYGIPAATVVNVCSYGGAAGDQETFGLANAAGTKVFASTVLITFKS